MIFGQPDNNDSFAPSSDADNSDSQAVGSVTADVSPTVVPDPLDNDAASSVTESDQTSNESAFADSPQPDQTASSDDDSLVRLKQDAISQLSPLVDQLDQSPEERFRTTMMMIQSTDDKTLLQSAYDAAQAIPDDKIRAQALLDVVNEINYFMQSKQ